jgi:hypothetical protein
MSFDVNPSEWRPHVSTNKAQAMDNDGRGSSAGGGGLAGSAFGQKEAMPNEDEISFSTKKKDVDEKIQDDFSNLWQRIVAYIKKLIKKLFNI